MYLQRRKEVLLAKKLTVPSICTLPYRPSNQKGAPWQHAWSAVVNPQFTRVGVGVAQDFPKRTRDRRLKNASTKILSEYETEKQ